MPKTLTEAQVLEKLNIPDFRHLSKDNVMSFASMIQNMDPEVAKKAQINATFFITEFRPLLKNVWTIKPCCLKKESITSSK